MATRRTVEQLLPLFIQAAKFRNALSPKGELDNAGAIHSASRTLDLLGQLIVYKGIGHVRSIKKLRDADCSIAVCKSKRKDAQIEHVQPIRALTIATIKAARINEHGAEERIKKFIQKNYRLALLTKAERSNLDKKNRTKLEPNRLRNAKIKMCPKHIHKNCKF